MSVTISGSGQIIKQVVQVVKTNLFTASGGTFYDITGLSASITPTSASNGILIFYSVATGGTGVIACPIRIMRNGAAISGALGNARSGNTQSATMMSPTNAAYSPMQAMFYLDMPATTSATTYNLQGKTESGQTLYIGGSSGTGNAYNSDCICTLTLFEVAYA